MPDELRVKPGQYWRQLSIFPSEHQSDPITIIGVGATGSEITKILAKIGCNNITVYDFDIIEDHNIPNQVFNINQIGQKKVEALKSFIKTNSGIDIVAKDMRFVNERIIGTVFLLVDKMDVRKQIWLDSIKMKTGVNLLIETRMGARMGLIYSIIPTNRDQAIEYEKTLYSDAEAEESVCTATAICSTVDIIAGLAVNQYIAHIRQQTLQNEVCIDLEGNNFPTITKRIFKSSGRPF